MGRKPNTVVSAHFTRGTKISDASNRYHWTCKQCGEGFPKGRIEGLYNHITKRCTALSLEEKSALVLKIHEFGLAASLAGGTKNKENLEKRKEAQSPFSKARHQSFNGLNVLAEASRQVVARQHSSSPVLTPEDGMGGTSMVLDPALQNEGNPSTFFYVVDGDESNREDGQPFKRRSVGLGLTSFRDLPTRHCQRRFHAFASKVDPKHACQFDYYFTQNPGSTSVGDFWYTSQ
jgi:hypothetical protein